MSEEKLPVFLDYDMALNLLDKAVGVKGADYVYPRDQMPKDHLDFNACLYFHEGQPSCLVGHVLDYLDVGPKDVVEGEGADKILSMVIPTVDAKTKWLLTKAQELQDIGKPWGEAIATAKEYADQRAAQIERAFDEGNLT